MSKLEKLRARFATIPSDFTWDEMVACLLGFGFEECTDKGGSYRCFVSTDGRKIFLHKPHPGNVVKRYALREVKLRLKIYGLMLDEDEDEK